MNFCHQVFQASGLSVGEIAELTGYSPATVAGKIGPHSHEGNLTHGSYKTRYGVHRRKQEFYIAFIAALDVSNEFVEAWIEYEKNLHKESDMGISERAQPVKLPIFNHKPPHFTAIRAPRLAAAIFQVKRALRCKHINLSIFERSVR